MRLLPASRRARGRLTVIAVTAPVVVLAVALGLYGLRSSLSLFYTPAQALSAHVPAGRQVQLGGMVLAGSVRRPSAERIAFVVADARAAIPVAYAGPVPDLFREGQGVVVQGAFQPGGVFVATQVLAKHDERYVPRQLARALRTVERASAPPIVICRGGRP